MSGVVVIGAGPAGSIAAETLSKTNDVSLLEEHKTQPVQCAGLISKSGLKRIGIKPKGFVRNKIKGALVHSLSGNVVEIDPKATKAYVVDRSEFDNHLMNTAIASGATSINERVLGIEKDRVKTKNTEIEFEKLIIATGTDYGLHRKLNLNRPKEFLIGAQYEMDIECNRDFVELYFNVPDFFSWLIPLEDRARVGLCTRANPTPYLKKFIRKLKGDGRVKNEKLMNKVYGIIPIYNPRLRTDYGNILLVGDAAAQVKATTGGGVVMGCMAARCTNYDYEKRWRKEIGLELRLHLMIRKFLNALSDRNTDRLLDIVGRNKELIENKGDMDIASRTLSSVFTNPRFVAEFLIKMPWFVWDIVI